MGELILKYVHFLLVSLYLGGVGLFLVATRQLRLELSPGWIAKGLLRLLT